MKDFGQALLRFLVCLESILERPWQRLTTEGKGENSGGVGRCVEDGRQCVLSAGR